MVVPDVAGVEVAARAMNALKRQSLIWMLRWRYVASLPDLFTRVVSVF